MILVLIPLVPIPMIVGGLVGSNSPAIFVGLGTGAFIGALYRLMCFPLDYTIGDGELVLRFGVFRTRIKLEDIERVFPARSIIGAPAYSLDRLCIDRRKGSPTYVSPKDQQAFMRDLAERAGHLELSGNKLRPLKATTA